MRKREEELSSDKLAQLIVQGMQEKKAEDIQVLDLRKVNNAVADFFVICSGSSDKHIEAIADSVKDEVHKICGQLPWHQEGGNNKSWLLLDYVDVVSHVFSNNTREFYKLENLWADAEVTSVPTTT